MAKRRHTSEQIIRKLREAEIELAKRHLVGGRAKMRPAASTSEVGRFETAMLTSPENLRALRQLCGEPAGS